VVLVNYWVIPISEENWLVVKETGVYGAPEVARGRHIRDLVKPGDALIFYVTKRGSKRLGGKFVGAYRVVSEWFREEKPLWPDEAREGRVKYPWRVRLEPLKLGVADYNELTSRLSFVVDKKRPGAPLIGTPGNYKRPIPRQDAELIINSLKPVSDL
jgi:predicted RNA-binding protein